MKKMKKCDYQTCNEDAQYLAREDLELCPEHYALYKFIDKILFGTDLTINIHEYKFKKAEP
jgi:hypothetical protein